MKKITLLLILISTLGMSQETITTKLGDFHTLKVFNGLTVELKKAATSKVVISGSQSEDVSIKNADGVLKIRLHFPDSFTAEDVKIVLFYSKDIDALDANEGGKIFSDETLKQQHLEVRTQEGAKINLAVNTKHLKVKSVSGGIIELTGVTENQTVEVTTGGIYEAFEMQSKQAIVTAASGANVEVSTSEILDAKVRFGGNIYYKGMPEVLKTKKVIGGKIVDKN
ncbi:head GIN domain-containing protein [uncultured Lutibacter sp.]|uniref:head GIN domain-containing protein n=1 Tax=uncultured Lutibacter sp. TaxID=437739 RepID=UPI00260D55F5|nr:head GIN domain-containing protein [uncultured Lutibacter sp.]